LFRVLFRVRVEGFTGKIESSRLMVIANHESFLDGLFLGLYLPLDPVFVVHTGVTRNWFFRMILTQVEHLAVDPTNPMAVKKVI
jgi:acyl-[acyl-carrier-protein]-phospholipid O-acyltransferase/long-chain-fatty-acid--[acyl-carrier-protein] ligase